MEAYDHTFGNWDETANFLKTIYTMTGEKVDNLQKPINKRDKQFIIEKVPQIREVHDWALVNLM